MSQPGPEQERLRRELYRAARSVRPREALKWKLARVFTPTVFRIGMLACLAGFVVLAVLYFLLVRA